MFVFTNGYRVVVTKTKISKEDNDDAPSHAKFEVCVTGPGSGEPVTWRPKSDDRRAITPERYLPFLTRIGLSRWRHDHSGEVFNITDLLEVFGDQLPPSFRSSIYGKKPEILSTIISEVHCRLIETQRLLILKERTANKVYYGHQNATTKSTLAIAQKAETLKVKISKEINDYAALSQSLDRSFPRRVVQQSTNTYVRTPIAIEELKLRLQDLDKKRDELTKAGILDAEADQPVALPPGDISTDIASVLQVYADDTQKKLSSLSRILEKINLFKRLIDQRFITKDVTISKKNGIDVAFHGNIVPLEKLSSGEQHQLVLFFELLFEIEGNSLILIDEPELSLHVA